MEVRLLCGWLMVFVVSDDEEFEAQVEQAWFEGGERLLGFREGLSCEERDGGEWGEQEGIGFKGE